ncbi:MAG: acyl carrier protein [Myxococcota bacterium]|jgi:acyl carrier protein|nr:acyl carrier protein [Myxococcota bacterium]
MADQAQLISSVIAAVAEISNTPEADVKTTDRLRDDLGLDSLQEMELMSRLSEQYDIDPEMEDVMKVTTVEDVATFLNGYLESLGEQAKRPINKNLGR